MPAPKSPPAKGSRESFTVSPVTRDSWEALTGLFGRAGASNGCWCQYWLLGAAYHRRDRSLNRQALLDETDGPSPGPGLLAHSADGSAVGWARLTPRSELAWLHARFGQHLPAGDDVWSMPCFFVRTRWQGRGVMSALISAGVDIAHQEGLPVLEAYPIDPTVEGATRNRFPGVLEPFLRAGLTEVSRLTKERAVVRYEPRAR
jgi:GNAT superfamily N-acetyltransferase